MGGAAIGGGLAGRAAGGSAIKDELGATGVIGALAGAASSTIVGNCTRWAQTGVTVPRHNTASRPRKRQAVQKSKAFKLGTEFERWESGKADIF